MTDTNPNSAPVSAPTNVIDLVKAEVAAALAVDPVTKKPGYQSTEFWSHIAVLVIGGAMLGYGASHGSDVLVGIGGMLVGVDSAIYKLVRGWTKSAEAKADAASVTAVAGPSSAATPKA